MIILVWGYQLGKIPDGSGIGQYGDPDGAGEGTGWPADRPMHIGSPYYDNDGSGGGWGNGEYATVDRGRGWGTPWGILP